MTIIWDQAKRSHINALNVEQGTKALQLISSGRAMLQGREKADLRSTLSAYTQGACSFHDHLQHEAREVIDEIGTRSGLLAPGDTFFDTVGGVKPDVLASLCPQLVGALYAARSN